MKKSDIVERIQKNEALVSVYEQLSKVSDEILNDSNDKGLKAARDNYEKAREALKAEQVRVLGLSKEFTGWQEESFRKSLFAFASAIRCRGFIEWVDRNGKTAAEMRLDTLSKAASYLGQLYKDYKDGAKIAKQKVGHLQELRKQLAAAEALQAKIKEELAIEETTIRQLSEIGNYLILPRFFNRGGVVVP